MSYYDDDTDYASHDARFDDDATLHHDSFDTLSFAIDAGD